MKLMKTKIKRATLASCPLLGGEPELYEGQFDSVYLKTSQGTCFVGVVPILGILLIRPFLGLMNKIICCSAIIKNDHLREGMHIIYH